MGILDIIGRFHPLLLHLPIGIFVYAFIYYTYRKYFSKGKTSIDIGFALGLGAMTAVLSAVSGYFLILSGEYGGGLLEWHQWCGFGTALGSVFLWIVYRSSFQRKVFFLMFLGFMILLIVTGHLGGTITHGEDFLWSSEDKEVLIEEGVKMDQLNVFEDIIQPIVKRKCVSCHGPKKIKGDLLLHTVEGWKAGGKSGSLLSNADGKEGLLFTRLHLPKEEKKHMPPSGKLQLTHDEMTLMDWWIKSVGSFDKKMTDMFPPDEVKNIIQNKMSGPGEMVQKIPKHEVDELLSVGVPVEVTNSDQPWISISYSRDENVTAGHLKHLIKFKKNVRELNMTGTTPTKKQLKHINQFSNLRSLDISQSEITSRDVAQLDNLENLEVLNLYDTRVDVMIFDHLKSFPKLRKIFLWQTQIQKQDIEFSSLPEKLEVIFGQDMSAFEEVQLLPPQIIGHEELFVDSILVEITHPSRQAKIYYTLGGEDPSISSPLYKKAIVVKNTSSLKAVAYMDGWKASKIAASTVLKKGFTPSQCWIDPAPNEKYSGDGINTIINNEKGSEQFGDGKWLGFYGEDVSITLDLGDERTVSSVVVGCLQDYRSYIFAPLGISVYTSKFRGDFSEVESQTFPQITGPADNAVKNLHIQFSPTKSRFVRLDFKAQKKNPSWHADPGADSWLFVDEVIVE